MSDINVTQRGSFDKVDSYLHGLLDNPIANIMEKYGDEGVRVLSEATPIDSGLAAHSWYYTIEEKPGYVSIRWHNSDIESGFPVVVMLQYGYGTKNGGYVEGHDFIMPAITPIFDKIMEDVTKEVTK